MKNTQILKVNHLSKNGVIIADDTDIVSLNVDKNNKITRTNLKNIENQTNHSINISRKIKTYQTKTYTVTTVQENHFRTTPVTQGINHHITQVIEEDHQNEEIHRIIHKIIIIDQIVEITFQDQIPMQHNLFLDPVPNQTQGINTIPIINHETHSNFSQMPNAAESLQMTMNPYLMGGSSITSNKPLMVFTGTDPEYSVED